MATVFGYLAKKGGRGGSLLCELRTKLIYKLHGKSFRFETIFTCSFRPGEPSTDHYPALPSEKKFLSSGAFD